MHDALRSIHWFLLLLEGGQFNVYLTAQTQNAVLTEVLLF